MNKLLEPHRVDPPKVLYRRFETKERAERFASGNFDLRNLLHYREHGDQNRRDDMEGISSIEAKGLRITVRSNQLGKVVAEGTIKDDIRIRANSPERYFISCFSTQCSPAHRKWGPWVVALHEPKNLFREMSMETPSGIVMIWGPVEYSDLPAHHRSLDLQDLWRRKRSLYADENEFRLALFVGTGQFNASHLFQLNAALKPGEAEVFQDS